MTVLKYDITLNNQISDVFKKIFGGPEYEAWAKAFSRDMKMSGKMALGEEIFFHDDKEDGMLAQIIKYEDNKIIEFKPIADIVKGERKDYQQEDIYERYTFISDAENQVKIEIEVSLPDEYKEIMEEMWEKAVVLIKEVFDK